MNKSKKKERQVGTQFDALPKNLGELEANLNELESRLNMVLREEVPPLESEVSAEDALLVPLASTVRGWCRQIRGCNGRVCDILDRLEL